MRAGIKNHLEKFYFKALSFMHKPFIKNSADDPYHELTRRFIDLSCQMTSPSILEIGSRNVTGVMRRGLFPNCADYVGLDIHPGDGVDIVGDIHNASKLCPPDHFDIVFSISVFEHILFPWKAVLEINTIMKTGGFVFLSTHPVWPAHELPWDYWRFPREGLHALFNAYTGFEILSVTEGLPCRAYSLVSDPPTRDLCFHPMHQGVAVLARKTGDYRRDLLKWNIDAADIIDTSYPIQGAGTGRKIR